MHDIVAPGGPVVDGAGGTPFEGDVAVAAGRVTYGYGEKTGSLPGRLIRGEQSDPPVALFAGA